MLYNKPPNTNKGDQTHTCIIFQGGALLWCEHSFYCNFLTTQPAQAKWKVAQTWPTWIFWAKRLRSLDGKGSQSF